MTATKATSATRAAPHPISAHFRQPLCFCAGASGVAGAGESLTDMILTPATKIRNRPSLLHVCYATLAGTGVTCVAPARIPDFRIAPSYYDPAMKRHAIAAALLLVASAAVFAQPRPFTIDDAMKLRSIVDVRIAPDGERVAYVISTPNLAKNEHEGALYLVDAGGGESRRPGEAVPNFHTPPPTPPFRLSSRRRFLGFIRLSGDKPPD